MFEREYRYGLSHYSVKPVEIPLQITTYGSPYGLLGPVFLLAPLALLAVRARQGRQLLLAAMVFGATYFGNFGPAS